MLVEAPALIKNAGVIRWHYTCRSETMCLLDYHYMQKASPITVRGKAQRHQSGRQSFILSLLTPTNPVRPIPIMKSHLPALLYYPSLSTRASSSICLTCSFDQTGTSDQRMPLALLLLLLVQGFEVACIPAST